MTNRQTLVFLVIDVLFHIKKNVLRERFLKFGIYLYIQFFFRHLKKNWFVNYHENSTGNMNMIKLQSVNDIKPSPLSVDPKVNYNGRNSTKREANNIFTSCCMTRTMNIGNR